MYLFCHQRQSSAAEQYLHHLLTYVLAQLHTNALVYLQAWHSLRQYTHRQRYFPAQLVLNKRQN